MYLEESSATKLDKPQIQKKKHSYSEDDNLQLLFFK